MPPRKSLRHLPPRARWSTCCATSRNPLLGEGAGVGTRNAAAHAQGLRPRGATVGPSSVTSVAPAPALALLHRAIGNRAVGALIQRTRETPDSGLPREQPTGVDSPGRPLDMPVRRALEAGYRTDLSGVRIHTDEAAAGAAHSLGAKAFAVGNEIWFGRGQYRPRRQQGRYLLAHEVAHTIQQRGLQRTWTDPLRVGAPNDPAEAA